MRWTSSKAENTHSNLIQTLIIYAYTIPGRFEDIRLTVVSALWDRSVVPAHTRWSPEGQTDSRTLPPSPNTKKHRSHDSNSNANSWNISVLHFKHRSTVNWPVNTVCACMPVDTYLCFLKPMPNQRQGLSQELQVSCCINGIHIWDSCRG